MALWHDSYWIQVTLSVNAARNGFLVLEPTGLKMIAQKMKGTKIWI